MGCGNFIVMIETSIAPIRHIEDKETGEWLILEMNREYTELIARFQNSYCTHESKSIYRATIKHGLMRVGEYCDRCGASFGPAKPQKDKEWVESLPWLPEGLNGNYEREKRAELRQMELELARKQQAERGKFTESYIAYLNSPEWKSKRQLVIKRCNNVCEGCGQAEVQEVHHLTYAHLTNEFLFELVGLYKPCHERIEQSKSEAREPS